MAHSSAEARQDGAISKAGSRLLRFLLGEAAGRKRHILVDTTGLLINAVVHSAAVMDRDGAFFVLGAA